MFVLQSRIARSAAAFSGIPTSPRILAAYMFLLYYDLDIFLHSAINETSQNTQGC